MAAHTLTRLGDITKGVPGPVGTVAYTTLRHATLRDVAAGRVSLRRGWPEPAHDGGRLSGQQIRTVNLLLRVGWVVSDPELPTMLTAAGRRQLAQWDVKHGSQRGAGAAEVA